MHTEKSHVSKKEIEKQEELEAKERFTRAMVQFFAGTGIPYHLKNITPCIDDKTGQYYYFTPLKYGKNTSTSKN